MNSENIPASELPLRPGAGSSRTQLLAQVYRDFGIRDGILFLLYRFLPLPTITVRLRHKMLKFPVWCRMGNSDISVFRSIFCVGAYRCFDDLVNPILIIDCGANVGYSSAYFLSRFPNVFVIAVEPDPRNFKILEKNLAPYAGRYSLLQSAIWSKQAGLKFAKTYIGLGHAVTVREAKPDEPAVFQSLTIDDILATSSFERISLLKMDIEGSETEVFASNYESWLPKVDNMAVELHGEDARKSFEKAIAGENFTVFELGELTICKRPE